MRYYLLEQDERSLEVPKLLNWYQRIDVRNLVPDRYHLIDDVTVLFCRFAGNSNENQLILEPWLLLPKEAAKIVSQFEPNMKYKNMPLVDQKREKMERYVFPLLKRYDCLNEKTKMNQDKSVITQGVLTKEKIPDQVLFIVEGPSTTKVVVRQDLVECLLKRYIFGFKLKELEVE